jgi:hypothetical protein
VQVSIAHAHWSEALQHQLKIQDVAHVLTFAVLQVFAMLMAEMVIFLALIVPLPFTWRRKLFTFISESPIIAKLQYGMKVRVLPGNTP